MIGFLLGRGKNQSCQKHYSPKECFKFRLAEVASGGFCGAGRFVLRFCFVLK